MRALTRTRENYVKMRSQIKNRVHQELEYSCIKLSSVISDIFGKSGIRIIRGLLSGESIENILKHHIREEAFREYLEKHENELEKSGDPC
ncbi:MAG: hypothetical protein A4E47_01294 [Methanosaeta sp. PtaU1.Bin028]|nr:MAG: hypothetical protein A4E47_01294 [Methanosaeta sp. PtaU1.Bin028]